MMEILERKDHSEREVIKYLVCDRAHQIIMLDHNKVGPHIHNAIYRADMSVGRGLQARQAVMSVSI